MSLNEATFHGVPILCFDTIHKLNAQHVEAAGIALSLHYPSVGVVELSSGKSC